MAGLVIRVADIVEALDAQFPFERAAAWDKNGLLVGNPQTEVSGIVVALDPTKRALEFAREKGANVILTHHPLFITDIASLNTSDSLTAEIAYDAIRSGIALVNCHTNLDVSERAKRLLGDTLCLNFFGDLPSLDEEEAYGALWMAPEPVNLKTFAKIVATKFGVDVRAYGDPAAVIERIATATGSARHRIAEAEAAACDVLVGGEIPYHDAMDAAQRGLATIAIGHDVSEWPLSELLVETIKQKTFFAPEKIYRMKTNYYWTPVRTETP